MSVRRKRYRVLVLASLVAAFIVPVGFALSLEAGPDWPGAALTETGVAPSGIAASIVVPRSGAGAVIGSLPRPLPDAAKLLLVGSVLIGVAAVVRKAG